MGSLTAVRSDAGNADTTHALSASSEAAAAAATSAPAADATVVEMDDEGR